ncbi:hypothetical protein WOLCODRAFT_28927 [Wolfiporia cocos MD-104 SS10]|uniref:Uncharacterized protein n=1 Tax=Wolfiporia cocos (strain MD-104) TaxID=742152 RepID=A0A2H3JEF1_WOLCO|nr:hypothetical protein WOLCODRAFT_28927 [Wolfiporia cocos MD-104 SS10]
MTTNTGDVPAGGDSLGQTIRGPEEVIDDVGEDDDDDDAGATTSGAGTGGAGTGGAGTGTGGAGTGGAGTGTGGAGTGGAGTGGAATGGARAGGTRADGASVRPGTANTASSNTAGVAREAGMSTMNAGAGEGMQGAVPQGQFEGGYLSESGAGPSRTGVFQGGRNNREFQAGYGAPQNQEKPA